MINVMTYTKYLMIRRLKILPIVQRCYGKAFEESYSDTQKEKILQVINEETVSLSSYEITKARVRNITEWIGKNGEIKTISDINSIDGFTEKHAKKLYNSILNGPKIKTENFSKRIKGQVLKPPLSETLRQSLKSVLAVYITVKSVCWTLINRENYEVNEWKYYNIDYPNGKKMQLSDILSMAWDITRKLPIADIYVMKAEATTLRATGSDPNNPKVLGVNLQKAQLVAMIVALIHSRSHVEIGTSEEMENQDLSQKVYFLRPTLPYRLYGTLVGNEHVSTDQTVENLLQEISEKKSSSQVSVPDDLVAMFRSQTDLKKDMLGQCLLLAITFMDVCIYFNKESINKLLQRGE